VQIKHKRYERMRGKLGYFRNCIKALHSSQ
jgi:hypothetical protein